MARLKDQLTAAEVKTCAAPTNKSVKITDGGGLYLHVHPNGSKYWRLAYRYSGKQRTHAIGVYPATSLKDARAERDRVKGLLKLGVDPSQEKKKLKLEGAPDNLFQDVALEWWESQRERWSVNHADRVKQSLEKEIFPAFGAKQVSNIDPQEVLAAIRQIESRDALDVSRRVLQRCSAVFQYAIITGRAKHNPARELAGVLKVRKERHLKSLPRSELPAFLREFRKYDGHLITIYALRLLLLTFCRPGEVRHARWAEFDFEANEWRIPGSRMKMGTEHIVPLSRQALAVLEELKKITGQYDLLFPGERSRAKPISENTMTFALYRMGYKDRATAHGFRATASSILNEESFHRDAVERQLAHQERNKVRGAYTHHAQYLDERKRMMQWWADYLDRIETD
ncbi:MAG: integrase [Pseudomonadales bacterium]|nr:integrase [Pseudomonadales bacterium]